MDYYDDSLGAGDRAISLSTASSWPPAVSALPHWRSMSKALTRLSSIPEAAEQQSDMWTVLQDTAQDTSVAVTAYDSCLQHPKAVSTAFTDSHTLPHQQQQESPADQCFSQFDNSQDMTQEPCSGVHDLDTPAAVAASAWATNIRHFTDCVPISPDSVCSSSTFCSLMVGSNSNMGIDGNSQQQQGQHGEAISLSQRQQHHRSSPRAVAAAMAPCSIPNSSSSVSLVPADDAAVAAGEAALQASLLEALHELDEMEFLPFDRVAQWLEAQAAGGFSSNLSDGVDQLQQQQMAISLGSSSGADNALQEQQEDALFDAPDWWQEAVVARLQQQREAFQGSWWSRARVLASLAAQKAACALQI